MATESVTKVYTYLPKIFFLVSVFLFRRFFLPNTTRNTNKAGIIHSLLAACLLYPVPCILYSLQYILHSRTFSEERESDAGLRPSIIETALSFVYANIKKVLIVIIFIWRLYHSEIGSK